jgi:hypothetical protein
LIASTRSLTRSTRAREQLAGRESALRSPAGSTAWYPSGDQKVASVFQGSLSPDLCAGGQISLAKGGTFTATVFSSDLKDKVSARWHYSANGSSGGWSVTAAGS